MPAMRERIAQLRELDVEAVNVQASTGNLSGDVGAGRAIAASAVATVARAAASER